MDASPAKPIGEVRDYAELLEVIRARQAALNITMQTLEEVAGLADRHASKILAPKPCRTLGMRSLGLILGALGLKLLVVEDLEQLERVRGRLVNDHPNSGPHRLWRSRQRALASTESSTAGRS